MFKKKMCVLCIAIAFCMIPSFVFAGENSLNTNSKFQITPNFVGVTQCTDSFSISSSKANAVISVNVLASKVDNAKFTVYLQQYQNNKWVVIKTWSQSKKIATKNVYFDETYGVTQGYKYRFKGTVKVYNGSTLVDTISITSDEKSY